MRQRHNTSALLPVNKPPIEPSNYTQPNRRRQKQRPYQKIDSDLKLLRGIHQPSANGQASMAAIPSGAVPDHNVRRDSHFARMAETPGNS